jgi:hypothetical protein
MEMDPVDIPFNETDTYFPDEVIPMDLQPPIVEQDLGVAQQVPENTPSASRKRVSRPEMMAEISYY